MLRDIDLRIPAGEVVALVGMSGGGKSTLADLIPRFYDVTRGPHHDRRHATSATSRCTSLRAHIAVVTQFTFLFNDTRPRQHRLRRPRTTDDGASRRRRAPPTRTTSSPSCRRATTPAIGELGVRLSGGQRQRLAIARALLKNAPILILDEATSALDTESERLVQEALERLMANRTTLVIAHRLSTVRRADRIVVLSRGQIVESGTHEELLARGREYRKLYELQFGEPEPAAAGGVGA